MRPLADALRALVGVCLAIGIPLSASAQVVGGPRPLTTAPPEFGFLTAFRTAIDVRHLNGVDADSRFNWDADLSVDVDVVDTGLFRGNLFINVETIVGSELREVDPNQNNYTADISLFVRLPHGELSTTFHHVSRHLADRATDDSVSWNMFGIGYGDRVVFGGFELDAGGRALWTVERAGVDYDAEVVGYATVVRRLTERLALVGSVHGVAVALDPLALNRSNQRGGRLEGGVRVTTGVATVDLFVAREDRIDATAAGREQTRWTQFGIRLVTPFP